MGLLQVFSKFMLHSLGWQMVGVIPVFPKYVLIAAHHTSNWDFLYAMLYKYGSGLRFQWIGKASLFKPPFGWLFRRLGGIPVWRDKKSNFVAQISQVFTQSERLVITIAPEGTRHYRACWKTGFYYMALGAGVPIVLGFIDYSRKHIGLGPVLHPTGDIQADMTQIQEFYAGITGLHPANQSQVEIQTTCEPMSTPPHPD